MDNTRSGWLEREGRIALTQMEEALELVDKCDGADDVGAHLDLAICRLRELMASEGIEASPRPQIGF